MSKKLISLLLTFTILIGCFSMGFGAIVTSARDIGIGSGAESFNPVKFSVGKEVLIGTSVNTSVNVEVTDKNYKAKINSMNATMIYYDESGASGNLSVSYTAGKVVSGAETFPVTGTITDNINTVVRYTIEYDILDKKDNTIWKNLTGYTYALVSSRESTTGAVGVQHAYPGDLCDGMYFEVLETLNTVYVQQADLNLLYKVRTQSAGCYHDARTRGVNVISGNPPSTLKTMPDNPDSAKQGQMDWPRTGAVYRSAGGYWLRMSEPLSGYYKFTTSFNSWGDEWRDQSNITETSEMYYIRNEDRVNAYNAANKIMKNSNTFADGFYVQKGLYTAESWNNLLSAIDMAYQVALSVPNANMGYKIACQNAQSADEAVDKAFADLQRAEHDFETYKDVVVVKPTCTDAGSETYTCICGEVKVVEIPALGHGQGIWKLVKPATCTEEGLDELICTVCNEVIESRVLSKIAHKYETEVIAPTCTEYGYTIYQCTECPDAYASNYVKETGHSWVHVITDPTCTEKGYTTHSCNNCDFVSVTTPVAALGHTPAAPVVENYVDATCQADGSYDVVVYCTTCNAELERTTEVLEKIPHTEVAVPAVEPTCTETGLTEGVACSACDGILVAQEVIDALGHDYVTAVTEPTCTAEGYTTYTCTACVDTYVADYTPIVPHNYESVVTEPTCTTDGYTTYTCTACDDTYTDNVIPAAHTEGKWVVTKEAEIGVEGKEGLCCAVCGEVYETRVIPAITAYFRAAQGSKTIIDKERGFIYGLEEGIYDLEGFVEYEGGILEYKDSRRNFGTGTTVNFVVNGVVIESYTIVIFGDITGDGVVDTYDTTKLAQIVNGDIEIEDGTALAFAADVALKDGVADTYDLTKLYQAVNGDITISQLNKK